MIILGLIQKYKSIFSKGYTPYWSGEVFGVSKIKNTVSWIYIISNLNGEPITGNFQKKVVQKRNNKKNKTIEN